MRFVGLFLLAMTFLAGLTVANITFAMINSVVFLALALLVVGFLARRYGQQGTMYGLVGAFIVSLMWPYALIAFLSGDDCMGDECLASAGFGAGAE